jgi:hypothetical protein
MPDTQSERYEDVIRRLEKDSHSAERASSGSDYSLALEFFRAWHRLIARRAPEVFQKAVSKQMSVSDWYFFFKELRRGLCHSWNQWRAGHPQGILDLTEFAPMIGHPGAVTFYSGDFSHSNFNGIALTEGDCRKANLKGAQFNGAFCEFTNFEDANLSGASFRAADLRNANFRGACVDDTDFGEALMDGTNWSKVDLSTAKNLDLVEHTGPSTIDIDTVYLSKGKIPLPFLRGCGVPELLITYLPSLVTQPVQFACFISYSTEDRAFANRLHTDLQNEGVRCWFAEHDIRGGKKVYEQIDEAIRASDRLLLILSADSLKSPWVETEIATARRRELRDGRRMLFPLRLIDFETLRYWECFDADTGKDSAREIREYFIPDFSNWENRDEYKKAFDLLIRDLQSRTST